MKRTLVALTTALTLTVGMVQVVPVSAQESGEPRTASSSSSDESSSEGSTVAFITLIAALGGGAFWAVQQGLIPNPLPGVLPGAPQPTPAPAPAPPRGACSTRVFNDALWEWRDSPRTRVEYCDGRFAWVVQNQTDWRVAFEFDGERWGVSWPAGTTRTGMMQGCYNGIELRNKGAAEDFISRLPICAPDEIGYSPW